MSYLWACYYAKEQNADLCVANLKKSIDDGLDDKGKIFHEVLFDNIRNAPAFQEFVNGLK